MTYPVPSFHWEYSASKLKLSVKRAPDLTSLFYIEALLTASIACDSLWTAWLCSKNIIFDQISQLKMCSTPKHVFFKTIIRVLDHKMCYE